MTSDRVRGWAEVGANVGVFLGILFLIYEVRQTTIGQRLEAQIGLSERFAELDGGVAENADLAELLVRANHEDAELSAAELVRYRAHYNRWMNILMSAEGLHSDGVFTDDDWREYACEVRRHYKTAAAFRRFVEETKQEYLADGIYDAVTKPTLCGE